jgi:hypothetical protein
MNSAQRYCIFFCFFVTALFPTGAAGQPASPPKPFDGRWTVSLVCEDVRDKGVLVKGYTFNFFAAITEGKLSATYGTRGRPSSLALTGDVQQDGTADIVAKGFTADPDFSVGHVQSGTPYTYRMRGTFTTNSGIATRIELRPCKATFSKQ